MEADINGPQRKTLVTRVRPVKVTYGTEGIALKDGMTLPFEVTRSWSAPAGRYPEQWFLVNPKTREVLYESRSVTRFIFGLQAPTEFTDVIDEPFALDAGSYQVVFSLGGLKGGETDVAATAAGASAA